MNTSIRKLIELQSLEFEELISEESDNRIEELRGKIPKPLLARYDSLCDQGKKAVAPLRGQVCGGCHITVPLGVMLDLAADRGGIPLCNNCGRFLYLDSELSKRRSRAKKSLPESRKRRDSISLDKQGERPSLAPV